jgi:hypothetical protein
MGASTSTLQNAAWQAVEIDAEGWRVVDALPVKFRRPATMAALPVPVRGGSVRLLRPFLNLKEHEDAWLLFVGYLVAFRPTPPYLVLVLAVELGLDVALPAVLELGSKVGGFGRGERI